MAKCSHFLVITQGNLDHLFSYAAGNGRDQKSDLALQASCPEGLKKVRGGGSVSLPPSSTLFCVFVHLLPHTHTYSRCTQVHTDMRVVRADREEKVDAMILLGGYWGSRRHTARCYIVVQSNDSERNSSHQYATPFYPACTTPQVQWDHSVTHF